MKPCKFRTIKKLYSLIKNEDGVAYVFEAAFIMPIVILILFLMLLLAMIYGRLVFDYGQLRYDSNQEHGTKAYQDLLQGKTIPASKLEGQWTVKREGLLFSRIRSSYQKHFQNLSLIDALNGGSGLHSKQDVQTFMNVPSIDLWHIKSLQYWVLLKNLQGH